MCQQSQSHHPLPGRKPFLFCDSIATNLSPTESQSPLIQNIGFSSKPLGSPFAVDPAADNFLTALRLIERYHVPSSIDSHERQIAMTLHLSDLPPITKGQLSKINLVVGLLSGPI